jgi:Domain of unknown function (DUF4160)
MAQVEIHIEDELLDELSERFFWEEFEVHPLPPGRDSESIGSALIVARVNGLSIKVWADEHPPPHFHVTYQGEDASFSILDCSRLPGVRGLTRYERVIRDWWEENQRTLIEKWNVSRPNDCPVGPINLPS